MSNQNMLKNFDKMKNMINVSLIDLLIPEIKSNQNENVIKMLDIVKDKPDAYLNLLSVAIFHKNLKIVELILDKYFTSDIQEPYINSNFLYNSILSENSKNKLTDKNYYTEEICPYAVMAGIGGDIEVFKCLYKKNLINNYNINNPGIIGLTKKYKNSFFSNIVGACAYYGNEKLLEYILANYRAELDINISSTEKKSNNLTKFHFSREYSEYSPVFLTIGGITSDKKTLEILKILEEYKANFESKDFNENNVLHIAIKEKKIMCLKFLVGSLGLNTIINEYNLNNETPYILAQQSKNKEIINFFDSYNTEDVNLIKKNVDDLIKEDNKNKNKKKNKKNKNKNDNLTLLHSSEYEETLGFNQDKQEEEKNDIEIENDNNEEIEEKNYSSEKIKEEKEETNGKKSGKNNKKYKNKKDSYYGKKYYDENDKYDSYKSYDDYKYDNKYIKYNSGNNLYYNKNNSNYNNDTYKKSKSNYDYNKGKYNNKNDYYNYNTKGNWGNKKEQREKYNNKKKLSNKNNYYIKKKEKGIAVEINGAQNDNKNNNNSYDNNEQKENNIYIKENLNSLKNEQNNNNKENNKIENENNLTNNDNILAKEKEKEDENIEEEEEDDFSYSEEDFLTQSNEKKEKEEKILNLSLSEYNKLLKKCLEAERIVNILEKENMELSDCIKKICLENNHKIEQNIPNEENKINSLLNLTNEELDKKDKQIKKLKKEAKMADLSDIKKLQKEQLKEYKNLYNKNLKIINDTLRQFEKH